jgi:hypothetical protein
MRPGKSMSFERSKDTNSNGCLRVYLDIVELGAHGPNNQCDVGVWFVMLVDVKGSGQ